MRWGRPSGLENSFLQNAVLEPRRVDDLGAASVHRRLGDDVRHGGAERRLDSRTVVAESRRERQRRPAAKGHHLAEAASRGLDLLVEPPPVVVLR